MGTICWIGSLTQKASELLKKLTAAGFVSKHLGVLSNDISTAKLQEVIPQQTTVLFVVNPEPAWVSLFVPMLRAMNQTAQSYIPIVAIVDTLDSARAEALVMAGINDLVLADTEMLQLEPRLKLRMRDAAERTRLDSERQAHALRDAKNETILKQREEFLSVCAHDLRSPLGLIQSCMTMILNSKGIETVLQPLHMDLITRARRQATQAITLVNDLLDVMAFEQGLKPQYQLLKLDDFLKEFHRDYSLQAGQKNVQFTYTNPIPDWRVLFDADRIRQLLQNLFTNALKFTDSGKRIHLSVMSFQGRRKTDPKFPMVVLSLKDEGRGIPQKELQKIFDRFTQVKDYGRSEGRGLGLTVAKQISNLHDGNIWVESTEGTGSTFFVLFPHVISRTIDKTESLEKNRVVIADPLESRRSSYTEALSKLGLEAVFVKDGIEALEQVFYVLPVATVLTGSLAKMGEAEVANILKGDPITAKLPLFFASEGGKPSGKADPNTLYDDVLKIPFISEEFSRAVDRVQKKSSKKAA